MTLKQLIKYMLTTEKLYLAYTREYKLDLSNGIENDPFVKNTRISSVLVLSQILFHNFSNSKINFN